MRERGSRRDGEGKGGTEEGQGERETDYTRNNVRYVDSRKGVFTGCPAHTPCHTPPHTHTHNHCGTGTLTKNEMTVVKVRTASSLFSVTGVGYAPEGSFHTTSFASDTPAASPAYPLGAPENNSSCAPAANNGTAATAANGAATAGAAAGATAAPGTVEVAVPLDSARLAALQRLFEGAVLCNDSALSKVKDEATGAEVYKPLGAPTEVALLTAGEKVRGAREATLNPKP